ncbi:DNA methyltransferase family protein [Mycobacteroides abscessus]|uniref:hypothetical protein n=1 Tax=Mycobacteroides abscessus TaxID=36809 RepID=UPI0009294F57|nr:hypothetical protein [Mycobacteroides abscessus]SHP69188.1 Uncharacterised protein [Mycobacteroides abscessus subsp. bolletii]SHS16859.1 Uncharacterised protein [Mycobacteroides abscessus subsp. bolletii]SHS88425.1 Uncharacterised protein [Mycobacteroides abscessus subsp. bolletii]SKF65634.1 Uncharacterised protein [Mycobacteroides abscessus subsp. bolletii]SKG30193.1 Uncharacterised protein [Mycobacteroides abscessus subsp. bolletii]
MRTPARNHHDAFYTPPWLADELAECLPEDLEGPVLDPTVGAGALLTAVCSRFSGRVDALGIDIDLATVQRLRAMEPSWVLSRADLLSAESRRASRAWRQAKSDVAAVVVNPPFSYRGNQGSLISFGGFSGRVAPAMHFLVELLGGLSPTAGFYAILPDGALEADKHEELWSEIKKHFDVERLKRFKTTSFRGARVSTSLVHLHASESEKFGRGPRKRTSRQSAVAKHENRCRCVEIIRGRVPVHTVKGNEEPDGPVAPFLHTTNISRLQSSAVDFKAASRLADDAPLVLLSRVGKWSSPVLVEIGRVVLSDCLFGLRPRDRLELEHLRADIEHAQKSFQALFKGTGAQYLTVAALAERLGQIGWHPHFVKASAEPGECCCRASSMFSELSVGGGKKIGTVCSSFALGQSESNSTGAGRR